MSIFDKQKKDYIVDPLEFLGVAQIQLNSEMLRHINENGFDEILSLTKDIDTSKYIHLVLSTYLPSTLKDILVRYAWYFSYNVLDKEYCNVNIGETTFKIFKHKVSIFETSDFKERFGISVLADNGARFYIIYENEC